MNSINIEAELTGSVWKIEVSSGDKVSEGDVLVILESMKMEIPLLATDDGVVKEIKVKEGDVVQDGDVVIIMEG